MTSEKDKIRDLFGNDVEGYEKFIKTFNATPEIKSLKEQIKNLERSFKLVAARQIASKVERIKLIAAQNLLKETKKREKTLNLFDLGFTDEEVEKILSYRMCLDVLADCVETFVLDINDILRKKDKSLCFEDFLPISKLLEESRKKLAWESENTEYRKYEPWGDRCDELIERVKETAKLIKTETNEILTNKQN